MSGFHPSRIPVFTELANEFAVFDRWFASVPASTQPNRFYVHSATSHGATSNVRKDLIAGFPQKTIFDSLDESGLSFGIYYQSIPATLFFSSLRKLKNVFKFHSYELSFKSHAMKGKLPNYVVVEQRWYDVPFGLANDDHPSHDVSEGQKFVKEVYEVLRFEHSSVPATVKKLFNLKSNFLTKRDAWAGTFDSYFNLRKTPRNDCPGPVGAKPDAKLSEFQTELVQLASQLNGDYVLNTYPDIGKTMTVAQAKRYTEDAVRRFLEAGRAALRAGANESSIITMRPSLTSRIAY
ncbi:Non-specific phospholipase C1 [Linum grandiflorum]